MKLDITLSHLTRVDCWSHG